MTSATDELRRLLDERGVEWEAPKSACADLQTFFKVGRWYITADSLWYDKERLGISMNDTLTPEQAIAATLGSGTCKDLGGIGANGEEVFHCSKCGCILSLFDSDDMNTLCTSFICDYPRFCPECGCKVVGA